uniref:Uncharacterized protein n=1 Tax=Opuntia streptacantha TaxID=393608 RepID=A0A7C8ZZ40_OPUST
MGQQIQRILQQLKAIKQRERPLIKSKCSNKNKKHPDSRSNPKQYVEKKGLEKSHDGHLLETSGPSLRTPLGRKTSNFRAKKRFSGHHNEEIRKSSRRLGEGPGRET